MSQQMFGATIVEFKDTLTSGTELLFMVLGKMTRSNDLFEVSPLFGPIFLLVFLVFVFIFLCKGMRRSIVCALRIVSSRVGGKNQISSV